MRTPLHVIEEASSGYAKRVGDNFKHGVRGVLACDPPNLLKAMYEDYQSFVAQHA